MLQSGKIKQAPQTGDKDFDLMFADGGPRSDLLHSFEALRSRRRNSYGPYADSRHGQMLGPMALPLLGAAAAFTPGPRKWRVGGALEDNIPRFSEFEDSLSGGAASYHLHESLMAADYVDDARAATRLHVPAQGSGTLTATTSQPSAQNHAPPNRQGRRTLDFSRGAQNSEPPKTAIAVGQRAKRNLGPPATAHGPPAGRNVPLAPRQDSVNARLSTEGKHGQRTATASRMEDSASYSARGIPNNRVAAPGGACSSSSLHGPVKSQLNQHQLQQRMKYQEQLAQQEQHLWQKQRWQVPERQTNKTQPSATQRSASSVGRSGANAAVHTHAHGPTAVSDSTLQRVKSSPLARQQHQQSLRAQHIVSQQGRQGSPGRSATPLPHRLGINTTPSMEATAVDTDKSGMENIRRQKLEALKARRMRPSPRCLDAEPKVESAIATDLVSMVGYAEKVAAGDHTWAHSASPSPTKAPYYGPAGPARSPPPYGSPTRGTLKSAVIAGAGGAWAADPGGATRCLGSRTRSPEKGTQTDPVDLGIVPLREQRKQQQAPMAESVQRGESSNANATVADDTRDPIDQAHLHNLRGLSARQHTAAASNADAKAEGEVDNDSTSSMEWQRQRDQGPPGHAADEQHRHNDGDGSGRRIRMAEMIRKFRAEPVVVTDKERDADVDADVVEASSGRRMPKDSEGTESPEGPEAGEEYPVDYLAAAVLQRSRAMLRERDAIQQRIQTALSKFGVGIGVGVKAMGPSQPRLRPRLQISAPPEVSEALPPDCSPDLKGLTTKEAFGAEEGLAAKGRRVTKGEIGDGEEVGLAFTSAAEHLGAGHSDEKSDLRDGDASRAHGLDSTSASKLGACAVDQTKRGGSQRGPVSAIASAERQAPWRERLRALLAQAGVDAGPDSSPGDAATICANAGSNGVSSSALASLSPPPPLSDGPGSHLKSSEVPRDPLQAWRLLRQQQQQRSLDTQPFSATAAALGLFGSDGQELIRRFDGSLGTHLPGGFSAARAALADWMGKVSDVATDLRRGNGGDELLAARLRMTANASGLSPADGTAAAAPAITKATVMDQSNAAVAASDAGVIQVPSVDELLSRLAQRFGLAPGTTAPAAASPPPSPLSSSSSVAARTAAASPIPSQSVAQSSLGLPRAHPLPANTAGESNADTAVGATAFTHPTLPGSAVGAVVLVSAQLSSTDRMPFRDSTPTDVPVGEQEWSGGVQAAAHNLAQSSSSQQMDAKGGSGRRLEDAFGEAADGPSPSLKAGGVTPPKVHGRMVASATTVAGTTAAVPAGLATQAIAVAVASNDTSDKTPVVEAVEQSAILISDVNDDDGSAPGVTLGAWPGWLAALGIPRPVDADLLPPGFHDGGDSDYQDGEGENCDDSVAGAWGPALHGFSNQRGPLKSDGGRVATGARAEATTASEEPTDGHDDVTIARGRAYAEDLQDALLRKANASPSALTPPQSARGNSEPNGRRMPEVAGPNYTASPETPAGRRLPVGGLGVGAGYDNAFSSQDSGRPSAESRVAADDAGPMPLPFTPILGSLLDQAVGGSLFTDSPLTSASKAPPSSKLQPQLQGFTRAPTFTEGPEGDNNGGLMYNEERDDGAGVDMDDAVQSFWPIASAEPVAELSPMRRRLGRGSRRVPGNDAEGDSGVPGGLTLRVPGDLSSSTPFSSLASSGGTRIAAILKNTVTGALFGDSPAASVDADRSFGGHGGSGLRHASMGASPIQMGRYLSSSIERPSPLGRCSATTAAVAAALTSENVGSSYSVFQSVDEGGELDRHEMRPVREWLGRLPSEPMASWGELPAAIIDPKLSVGAIKSTGQEQQHSASSIPARRGEGNLGNGQGAGGHFPACGSHSSHSSGSGSISDSQELHVVLKQASVSTMGSVVYEEDFAEPSTQSSASAISLGGIAAAFSLTAIAGVSSHPSTHPCPVAEAASMDGAQATEAPTPSGGPLPLEHPGGRQHRSVDAAASMSAPAARMYRSSHGEAGAAEPSVASPRGLAPIRWHTTSKGAADYATAELSGDVLLGASNLTAGNDSSSAASGPVGEDSSASLGPFVGAAIHVTGVTVDRVSLPGPDAAVGALDAYEGGGGSEAIAPASAAYASRRTYGAPGASRGSGPQEAISVAVATEGDDSVDDRTTDPSSRGLEADRSNSMSAESVSTLGDPLHAMLYSLDIEELVMLSASHSVAASGGESVRSSAAAAAAALAAAATAAGMSFPEAAAAAAAATGSFDIGIDPVTGESGLVFVVEDPLEMLLRSSGGGGMGGVSGVSSTPMGRRVPHVVITEIGTSDEDTSVDSAAPKEATAVEASASAATKSPTRSATTVEGVVGQAPLPETRNTEGFDSASALAIEGNGTAGRAESSNEQPYRVAGDPRIAVSSFSSTGFVEKRVQDGQQGGSAQSAPQLPRPAVSPFPPSFRSASTTSQPLSSASGISSKLTVSVAAGHREARHVSAGTDTCDSSAVSRPWQLQSGEASGSPSKLRGASAATGATSSAAASVTAHAYDGGSTVHIASLASACPTDTVAGPPCGPATSPAGGLFGGNRTITTSSSSSDSGSGALAAFGSRASVSDLHSGSLPSVPSPLSSASLVAGPSPRGGRGLPPISSSPSSSTWQDSLEPPLLPKQLQNATQPGLQPYVDMGAQTPVQAFIREQETRSKVQQEQLQQQYQDLEAAQQLNEGKVSTRRTLFMNAGSGDSVPDDEREPVQSAARSEEVEGRMKSMIVDIVQQRESLEVYADAAAGNKAWKSTGSGAVLRAVIGSEGTPAYSPSTSAATASAASGTASLCIPAAADCGSAESPTASNRPDAPTSFPHSGLPVDAASGIQLGTVLDSTVVTATRLHGSVPQLAAAAQALPFAAAGTIDSITKVHSPPSLLQPSSQQPPFFHHPQMQLNASVNPVLQPSTIREHSNIAMQPSPQPQPLQLQNRHHHHQQRLQQPGERAAAAAASSPAFQPYAPSYQPFFASTSTTGSRLEEQAGYSSLPPMTVAPLGPAAHGATWTGPPSSSWAPLALASVAQGSSHFSGPGSTSQVYSYGPSHPHAADHRMGAYVPYAYGQGTQQQQQQDRGSALRQGTEVSDAWPISGAEEEDVIVTMLKRKLDSCMDKLRSLERNLHSPPSTKR